jgi:hypothetical protein
LWDEVKRRAAWMTGYRVVQRGLEWRCPSQSRLRKRVVNQDQETMRREPERLLSHRLLETHERGQMRRPTRGYFRSRSLSHCVWMGQGLGAEGRVALPKRRALRRPQGHDRRSRCRKTRDYRVRRLRCQQLRRRQQQRLLQPHVRHQIRDGRACGHRACGLAERSWAAVARDPAQTGYETLGVTVPRRRDQRRGG